MSILWTGAEDIDFPNGAWPVELSTSSGHLRTGYARCTVGGVGTLVKSSTFAPVTSCWLSAQLFPNWAWNTAPCFGLGKSGTNSALMAGIGGAGKVGLLKRDAGSNTVLAESTISPSLAIHRIDMQVISYGASATVNVWWDGVLALTFTGNVAAAGVSNLDQVWINGDFSHYQTEASEIIVADEDTRAFGVVTLAPNANGTTQQWTGALADINEITLSDATLNFTNTASQDQQYNLIDLPSGNFIVKEVMVSARANTPAGSTATKVSLGVKSGATINAGALQTAAVAFATFYQAIGVNDPATGAAWTNAGINALQMNLRSG